MTAAELNAVTQLSARFDDFREDNKTGHEDIKDFIKAVETRLTQKICQRDADFKALEAHCNERAVEVDASIARARLASEAEIAAAKTVDAGLKAVGAS